MKNRHFLLVFLALAALIRWGVYLSLPPLGPIASAEPNTVLYFQSLRDHLGEYIRFSASKPPLTHLMNAWVVQLAGAEAVYSHRLLLLRLFAFDLAALALLLRAATRLGARPTTAFAVVLGFSLALVPFEVWRQGSFYDQLTVFFTSLFACALVEALFSDSAPVTAGLAAASALLVAQSGVNLAVVPAAAVLLYAYKASARRLAAVLGAVLLVAGFCRAKNADRGGAAVTANEGGAALMMVVQKSLGYDDAAVRRLAVESGAPEWYLWCYDHATPLTDARGVPYPGWDRLARAFGICSTWPFDSRPLQEHLTATGQTALAEIVSRDIEDKEKRPWIYAGYSPELEPRWIGVYGGVSYRVAWEDIKRHPLGLLKAFKDLHFEYSHYGPYFPRKVLEKSLSGVLPATRFFWWAAQLFGWLAAVLYRVILIIAVLYLLRSPRAEAPWLLVCAPFAALALIFSTLTGGENDRYFMQAYPYLVVLSPVLIDNGLAWARRALARAPGKAGAWIHEPDLASR